MAKGEQTSSAVRRRTSYTRCSNAEICVVLCNQGLEAIDRERFGRSITIIRRITIKGASNYLVKNEYGSLWTMSSADLLERRCFSSQEK